MRSYAACSMHRGSSAGRSCPPALRTAMWPWLMVYAHEDSLKKLHDNVARFIGETDNVK